MNALHCFSMLTCTRGWSGLLPSSPSLELLHFALLAGSLLIAFVGIVLVVEYYGGLSSVWASMTKKSSKACEAAPRSPIWHTTTRKAQTKINGMARYTPVVFCAVFAAGMIAGRYIPHATQQTLYGLRVQRVLPPDSMDLISRGTGPFRGDFCPKDQITKYEPRPGYVMCRLQYVDKGCMEIAGKNGSITWVKDADGSTATLSQEDSFEPWPNCVKENFNARR